jgi:hypothetical protein
MTSVLELHKATKEKGSPCIPSEEKELANEESIFASLRITSILRLQIKKLRSKMTELRGVVGFSHAPSRASVEGGLQKARRA